MKTTANPPLNTPAPFQAIAELARRHAVARPTQAALIQGERSVDWRQLDTMMDRVAASLQRDGVEPQQTIAICAANSLEYAAVFLGAMRAGVAVAPLPAQSLPAQLSAMVADSGARHFFIDASVPAFETSARRIFMDSSSEPSMAHWLVPEGTLPAPAAIQPQWPFNIIYSSGTTGTPKGIVQSHAMRWAHVSRAENYGYGPQAVTLIATSLCSNTTLVCFFPTIAKGGTVVLAPPKFDATTYLALAEKTRATHAMLVPVQYQRIMALPQFDDYNLSSFVAKFCTSAPFHAQLKADVLARWPGGLVEFYGMTEGGGTCILEAHNFPDKLHTVGRPAEGHDMRLIGEDERELPVGAVGELVGRSPAMMTHYHNQSVKTREAEWYDSQGNRFIRTGDVGRFDEDGFLTLMDRRKDMVISGGFNIYPSDLEAVLLQHPAVADAAVIGVPSQEWGETPVAFVVLREGDDTRPDEIRTWANSQLGKTQRLSGLHCVGELPRSEIGKVLKRQLRDAWSQANMKIGALTGGQGIRRVIALTDKEVDDFAELLIDCVAGGATVSFLHPVRKPKALDFWRRVVDGVVRGECALLVAEDASGIVGTVQLVLNQPENQSHRADLRRARRQGLGASLMKAAEQLARERDRSLLILNTTSSDAERLYLRMGWQRCGMVPGYAAGPKGELYATTYFYRALD